MDFRRVQIIDCHEELVTQKFSPGGISLVKKAIWIDQWTPILLKYNAPGNSPREFEANQLSFHVGKSLSYLLCPLARFLLESKRKWAGMCP
jgi:hypothetical protein